MESYLLNRQQKVFAKIMVSVQNHRSLTQGVPQGSVLGNYSTSSNANEISKIITNCGVALYADDTLLYTANANFGESVKQD